MSHNSCTANVYRDLQGLCRGFLQYLQGQPCNIYRFSLQTGLHSLMSMKKSDISSKKDDNEPKNVCTLVEYQFAC